MLAGLLRRFEPFAALEWTTLCSVARHARLLRCAAARTLVQSGHNHHSCYLVKGSVRRRSKDGRIEHISHDHPAARYPLITAGDGTSIETLGQVTLLWIDVDPVAFMLGAGSGSGYSVEPVDAEDAHWMHRFLGRGIVEWLAPGALQAVFRAFAPRTLKAGDEIVRQGEPADAFFVLANGSAEVRRDGHRIVVLAPGDSFGADALVGDLVRNSTVAMLTDGRVMSLTTGKFQRLLATQLVRWIDAGVVGCHELDLSRRRCGPDALRTLVAELDLGASYVFSGGSEGDRALAVFLAAQRGVSAFARRGSSTR